MSDIRDFFIKTLDEAESGINGMMLRFYRKIKSIDAKVEARLVDQDIKPQYFSFRYVKFIYSEKARKFCGIFILLLTGTT